VFGFNKDKSDECRIQKLIVEKKELEELKEHQRIELQKLRNTNGDLRDQVSYLQEEYNRIKDAKEVVRYTMDWETDQYVADNKILEEKNKSLRKELDCQRRERDRVNQSRDELEIILNEVFESKNKTNNSLREKIKTLEDQIADLQYRSTHFSTYKSELERYQDANGELSAKLESLEYDLESAKCQGKKYKEQAEKLERQNHFIKLRKDEYLELYEKTRNELSDLRTKLHSIKFVSELYSEFEKHLYGSWTIHPDRAKAGLYKKISML
jgi:chromosome segregation ATPase